MLEFTSSFGSTAHVNTNPHQMRQRMRGKPLTWSKEYMPCALTSADAFWCESESVGLKYPLPNR